ncbi:TraA_Ti, Ti-type conjugative transfer relaxase TraA [Comamonadaceae bacterium]
MIRIKAASASYLRDYIDQEHQSYLDGSQVREPEFGGTTREHFGMGGKYDREVFRASIEGHYKIHGEGQYTDVRYHSSGEKRLESGKVEQTDAAVEVVMCPPKSWSLAIEFSKGDEKERLEAMLAKAMDESMAAMEKLASVRVTKDGVTTNMPVQGLTWTRHFHSDTRRGDVDYHTHNIINKQVLCQDGQIRTLDLASVIYIQQELDAHMKTSLARQAAEHGYELDFTENGPELASITPEMRKCFSTASEEMKAFLEEHGIDIETAGESTRTWANLETRLGKVTFDQAQITERYRKKLASIGLDLDKIQLNQRNSYQLKAPRSAREAIEMALADFHEREDSIKSRHNLAYKSAVYANFSVTVEEINIEIDAMFRSRELVERYTRTNGRITAQNMTITSAYALEREIASVSYYKAGHGQGERVCSETEAAEAIEQVEAEITQGIRKTAPGAPAVQLTKGQIEMVHSALGLSNSQRICAVEGDPGTGKTTGMQAVRIAAERSGWTVKGLAPSDQAREALSTSGIETETIQMACKSKGFWESLDHKTILIVDESGMVDSRQMNKLLEEAQSRGVRVVLVGDTKQLQSVEAGTPFGRIVHAARNDGTLVEMKEMTRGRTAEMRHLHDLSRDDQAMAIKTIMNNGTAAKAKFYSEKEKQFEYVAEAFRKMPVSTRLGSPVIGDTNADRKGVTDAIRSAIGQKTVFEMNSFEADQLLTRAQHRIASTYQVGDHIKMSRKVGVFAKGEILEVLERKHDSLVVSNGQDQRLIFRPDQHGECASIGEFERVQIGEGDLLRVGAKWQKAGLRNGDRLVVTNINNDGKATVDIVDYDGKKQSTKQVDFSQKGITIRSGYASTVHGLQGASIEQEGFYVASRSSRNAFMVGVTRFKNSFQLVGDANTKERLEQIIRRSQSGQIKAPALPQIDELIDKMTTGLSTAQKSLVDLSKRFDPRLVRAAWPLRKVAGKRVNVHPFPRSQDLTDKEVSEWLHKAVDEHGDVRITGSREFLIAAEKAAKREGLTERVSYSSNLTQESVKSILTPNLKNESVRFVPR